MICVSFAMTSDAYADGTKTETRRFWKPQHAAKFTPGRVFMGITKDFRAGGVRMHPARVVECRTERLGDMSEDSFAREGGTRYWPNRAAYIEMMGGPDLVPYVLRFEHLPVEQGGDTMKHGCCTDKACTPETCMELPQGKTCADCVRINYCISLGVTDTARTSCDWFPRRFKDANRFACPSCGGTTHHCVEQGNGWQGECFGCHMRGPWRETKTAAFEAWLSVTDPTTPTVQSEIVPRFRTRKLMLWFKHICGEEFHCEIAQGEPCDYFAHSDTYVFAGRNGVAPWFSRRTVEANPVWFEAVHNAAGAGGAK